MQYFSQILAFFINFSQIFLELYTMKKWQTIGQGVQ